MKNEGELPNYTMKKLSLFNKVVNWVKGINFHFELGTEITIGAQGGLDFNVGKREIGAQINLISMVLLEGKATGLVGSNVPDGATGSVEGYYAEKDGVDRLKHGLEIGIGPANGGIEHTWEPSERDQNHKTKISGGAFIFDAETILQEPSKPDPTQNGIHMNAGIKAAFLLGIEIKCRIGFTHD